MEAFLAFYLRVLVALIAICDPLGNMPIFVSLTSGEGRPGQRATARMASVAVLVVFVVFALFGGRILALFSIGIPAFRTAAGIVLLLMGIAMLQATPGGIRRKPEEIDESTEKEHVAVVPLAIPLLAGPGAMSTVILFANQAHTTTDYGALYAAQATTALVIYVALRSAPPLIERLGQTGVNIVTRIMGLIVIAIGVEFMAAGARELFPILGGS